jgi:hypothetical protein
LLVLVYVALTAKPLSLRRLLMLFGLALLLANLVFLIIHAKHASQAAFVTAAAITLVAWSTPLVVLTRNGMLYRRPPTDPLVRVSGFVRWTYGFAVALAAMLAITVTIDSRHQIALAGLTRSIVVAGFVGAVLERGFSARNERRRSLSPALSLADSGSPYCRKGWSSSPAPPTVECLEPKGAPAEKHEHMYDW